MALIAVSSLVIGVLAGRLVKSPAQVAADAAPPPVSTLTATVEQRQVTRTVALSGVIAHQETTEITLRGGDAEQQASVVSAVRVRAGDEVKAGAVLAEVGGRPVIALPGAMAAYRVIAPGASGPDVAQLNKALAGLGYRAGKGDSVTAETQAGLRDLYQRLGFTPITQGEDEVRTAERAETTAARALAAAERALTQAQGSGGAKSGATADTPGGQPTAATTGSTANAGASSTAGQVEDARQAVTYAREDLTVARADLAKARGRAGVVVGLGEIAFVPTLPATVRAVAARPGDPSGVGTLTVTSGALVARGTADTTAVNGVVVDQGARVITEGGTVQGTVSDVRAVAADAAGGAGSATGGRSDTASSTTGGGGGQRTEVTISVAEGALTSPPGSQVRIMVATETAGRSGLAVPSTAIISRADGSTVVRVIGDGDVAPREVPVSTGFSGDGYVAITPTEGELTIGQTVQVGGGALPTAKPSR